MDIVIIENQFTQTVEAISKVVGWTVDRKIILAIASTYVASGKVFDSEKKDLLTIEETEKVLFNPYTMDLLQSKGISKEILEIIHLGTELEDIVSLMSEKLFESLSEIEYESIAQLEQRKAYKFRNKVIESIN